MATDNVADAWVELHADDTLLPAEVKVAAERASRSAKVKVDMEIDRNSITRSLRSVGSVSVSTVGSFTKLTAGVAATSAGLLSLATVSAGTLDSLGGLGAGVVAVTSALAAAVPAAVALGGAFAALGLGAGAAIVGFQGMGDAMKAQAAAQKELQETGEISEATQTKLNAAMANLAPAARAAAKAMGELQPRLEAIRKSVQEKLFAGMASEIGIITDNLLPVFRRSLDETAVVINNVGNRFARFTENDENMDRINTVMESLSDTFSDLARSIVPFGNALLNIFVAASPVTERFAEAIRSTAVDLSRFFEKANESGELTEFFNQAGDAAATLGSILGNLGDALGSIFGAGAGPGAALLETFDAATERMAAFFDSVEGQTALDSFFLLIGAIGEQVDRVTTILGPLFSGIMEGLAPLIPALGELVSAFTPVAVALSTVIGGIAADLGPVLADVVKALEPVIVMLGTTFVDAIETIAPAFLQLIEAFTPVLAVLGTAFSGVLVAVAPLITQLVTALTPLVETVGLAFADLVTQLTPLIESMATAMIPLVEALVAGLLPVIEALVPVFVTLVEAIAPLIPQLVEDLIPILPELSEALVAIALATADWLVAITPLLPDIVALIGAVLKILVPLLEFVTTVINLTRESGALDATMGFVVDTFHLFIDPLTKVLDKIGDFLDLISEIPGKFTSALDGIQAFIDDTVAYFRDLPGKILDALGNIAGDIKDKLTPDIDLTPWEGLVPGFATGGVVTGPTLAMVGEGGGAEAIFPLSPGARWTPGLDRVFDQLAAQRGSGGNTIEITQQFFGPTTGADRLRELEWTVRYATERDPVQVTAGGGS